MPEFEVQPDPAKLLQTRRHRPEHPRRDRPQQHDRFARPDRGQSPAGAQPGQRPGAHARRDRQHRRQDDAGRRAGAHRRRRRPSAPSVMPVYTMVTANGKPAVLLNIFRQPDSNTVAVADAVHAEIEQIRKRAAEGRRAAAVLRPVGDRQRLDQERARRHPASAWCWRR